MNAPAATTADSADAAKRPVEGYLPVVPKLVRDGETVTVDSGDVYYKQLNEAVRSALDGGAKTLRIENVNGQRYIGAGLRGDARIEAHGTVGNDLAMFMDGPTVEVFGNAQDGVGNTMNSGTVIVHGDAGDVLGYGMRGGTVLVEGDVGYRVGIHMKAYESHLPVMVCGGKARDFFGEYMAGGVLVLLGMRSQFEAQPLVGGFCGSGMHGGVIYLRGEVDPDQVGKECGIFTADEPDMAELRPYLESWCAAFGEPLDQVLAKTFTKLLPVSHRPYGKLYANM